jgi:hypothetical protein
MTSIPLECISPDHEDRLEDFFVRHGGRGTRAPAQSNLQQPGQGRYEVYAQDGYTLRCDWSIVGTRGEMKYSEIAPLHNG